MLETAFIEPELLAGPEHLGHEAQPVLAVEPGGLACVDGAHLADEVVAQGVQLATAACSSLSRTVTVRVLTVLVLRLTDSSLPWARRL